MIGKFLNKKMEEFKRTQLKKYYHDLIQEFDTYHANLQMLVIQYNTGGNVDVNKYVDTHVKPLFIKLNKKEDFYFIEGTQIYSRYVLLEYCQYLLGYENYKGELTNTAYLP